MSETAKDLVALIAEESHNFSHLLPKQQAFLALYALTYNVSVAAKRAGISRRTPYDWEENDPDFAEAWKVAGEIAVDRALESAWLQGVVGVKEPVYQGGMLVGHIRRRVPSMTKLILQAGRPHEFADRTETTVKGTVGHLHVHAPDPALLAGCSGAELAILEEGARIMERQRAMKNGQKKLPRAEVVDAQKGGEDAGDASDGSVGPSDCDAAA